MCSWRLRTALWLSFLCLPLAAGRGIAAPPGVVEDILYTMQARKLLAEDAALRPLNLGVSVKNRVATLWGPVPKAELGRQAESRLRKMIELRDVRNELDVTPE